MQLSSKQAVLEFLRDKKFTTVLDAPSGAGWLAEGLAGRATLDGVDLYADAKGYRKIWQHDLDQPLPTDCGAYDLICCCEGLEHVGNPLLLLREFHRRLPASGLLIVTTPNVWYPQARLQFLLRGFFPSFPPLAGKITPGTHMHIMPWSWPQLYLYLKLAGFGKIELVPEPMSRAKHLHEHLLAVPARMYCRRRERRAETEEEKSFWRTAASDASLLGRHLIVAARKT
ncbi:MAG: methyltransferase domain-containing protein [Verrucomicrobia bacterium]|nr:methyltransferase domain-containing protein [Verrucomicrobiota bacterium]